MVADAVNDVRTKKIGSFLPGVVVPVAKSCAGAQSHVRKSAGFVHQPNSRKEILFWVFDLYVFVFTRSRYCIIECRFSKMTARYRDDICETQLPSSKKGLDFLKAGLLESKQESLKLPGLVYLAWLLMIPSPPNTYTCTWNTKNVPSEDDLPFHFGVIFRFHVCWGLVQWVWKNMEKSKISSSYLDAWCWCPASKNSLSNFLQCHVVTWRIIFRTNNHPCFASLIVWKNPTFSQRFQTNSFSKNV